jgi:hypothetical protein
VQPAAAVNNQPDPRTVSGRSCGGGNDPVDEPATVALLHPAIDTHAAVAIATDLASPGISSLERWSLSGALGAREQSDALGICLAGPPSGWGEAPAPLLEKKRHA